MGRQLRIQRVLLGIRSLSANARIFFCRYRASPWPYGAGNTHNPEENGREGNNILNDPHRASIQRLVVVLYVPATTHSLRVTIPFLFAHEALSRNTVSCIAAGQDGDKKQQKTERRSEEAKV